MKDIQQLIKKNSQEGRFMEGLNVDIVEQTDGATLLSSTIQNGQLFVSYNNAANYIVLKTK